MPRVRGTSHRPNARNRNAASRTGTYPCGPAPVRAAYHGLGRTPGEDQGTAIWCSLAILIWTGSRAALLGGCGTAMAVGGLVILGGCGTTVTLPLLPEITTALGPTKTALAPGPADPGATLTDTALAVSATALPCLNTANAAASP